MQNSPEKNMPRGAKWLYSLAAAALAVSIAVRVVF
jgi:hypothetical protein